MKKLLLLTTVLVGTAAASHAGVSVHIGIPLPPLPQIIIGHPAPPVIVAQPPVVYSPPPVVVRPPVHCAPPPVVYAPPARVVYVPPPRVVYPPAYYYPGRGHGHWVNYRGGHGYGHAHYH